MSLIISNLANALVSQGCKIHQPYLSWTPPPTLSQGYDTKLSDEKAPVSTELRESLNASFIVTAPWPTLAPSGSTRKGPFNGSNRTV